MLATLCATLGCLLNGSVIGFSSPAIPSLLENSTTNVYGGYTAVRTEHFYKSGGYIAFIEVPFYLLHILHFWKFFCRACLKENEIVSINKGEDEKK